MPIAPNIAQCQHVHTNGTRCGSPAMRSQRLCFYHLRTTRPYKPEASFVPPLLEDGNAIQHGIAKILSRLENKTIEYKEAALMLYSYQLASQNLRNVHIHPYGDDVVITEPAEQQPSTDGSAIAEPTTLADEHGTSWQRERKRVQAVKEALHALQSKRSAGD